MGTADLLLTPFYILFILIGGRVVKSIFYANAPHAKYLVPGLAVKVFAAVGVGLVYHFYYGGGDTFAYYSWANGLIPYMLDQPGDALRFVFTGNPEQFYEYTFYNKGGQNFIYRIDTSELFVIKLAAVANIFGLNTFLTTSILFATLSYVGIWLFYSMFVDMYPQLYKKFAIAILFIPSVFFWGSGILKDSVTIGFIGTMTWGAYMLLIKGRKPIIASIALFGSAYVLGSIKGYILLAFLPPLVYWVFYRFRGKIGSRALRYMFTPLFIAFIFGTLAVLLTQLGDSLGRFSIENLERTANDYQTWHTVASEGGSGYNLGDTDYSPLGLLRKFPLGVNVTLFRPYLWEAYNAVLLLAALESLAITIYTVRTLIMSRVIGLFRIVAINPDVFFCIFFALVFAFAVGFTSYNFGALVRYKIPCIPFYLCGLILVNHYVRKTINESRGIVSSN